MSDAALAEFLSGTSEFSVRWMITLLHFLWQGTVIAGLTVGLLHLLKHSPAAIRYRICAVALLSCPVTVAVTSGFVDVSAESGMANFGQAALPATIVGTTAVDSSLTDSQRPDLQAGQARNQSSAKSLRVDESAAADSVIQPLPGDEIGTAAAAVAASADHRYARIARWVMIAYAVGVCGFLMRLNLAMYGSRRLRRQAVIVEDPVLVKLIAEQARRIGLRLVPVVASSGRVAVPIVIGVLRPLVLLPTAIVSGLSPQDLAAVVAHECAHIRRHDLWMNLTQRLIESLLFFHPGVWLLSRRLSAEREVCCDDLVVSSGNPPLLYAQALLQTAELCLANRTVGLTAVAATGTSVSLLQLRIERLIGCGSTPRLQVCRTGLIAVLAVAVAVVGHLARQDRPGAPVSANAVAAAVADPETDAEAARQSAAQQQPGSATDSARLVYGVIDPDAASGGSMTQQVIQSLPTSSQTPIAPAEPLDLQQLSQPWRKRLTNPGSQFRAVDNTILQHDPQTEQARVLLRGQASQRGAFMQLQLRAAISPDGERLAALTFSGGVEQPEFDLHIIDLSADLPTAEKIHSGLKGDLIGTGGGFHAVAPPLLWVDQNTLLLATSRGNLSWTELDEASPDANVAQLEQQGRVVIRGGEVLTPTHDLLQIETQTGSAEVSGEVKLATRLSSDPWGTDFWRRSDGAIMLRSRGIDTRIDLQTGQTTRDRFLSPEYELKGDWARPSLWFGDEQLAEMVYFKDINVSPDGRQIVWMVPTNPRHRTFLGNTQQFPTELWYHSAETGKVLLNAGRFPSSNSLHRPAVPTAFTNPVNDPRFDWIMP